MSAIAFADAEKAIINTNPPLLYEEKADHLRFTITRNPLQSGGAVNNGRES